jgi:8-oxo-dGTP pyrophosphatase MutT (NUDIX family)
MSPFLERLRRALNDRPVRVVSRPEGYLEAAVALLVRETPALEILLIHRADLEGDPWAGHIALPGGRREARDRDLLATALREAEEELGAAVARVGDPLGRLPEIAPSSPRLPPFVIAPFVIAVPPAMVLRPDAREVQEAFWVPVRELRAADAATEVVLREGAGRRTLPGIRHGPHTVWGLTLGALGSFFDVVDAVADS